MKDGRGRRVFIFNTFDITGRELLASVSIIAVMLLFGVLIGDKISDRQLDRNAKYDTAVKINTQELFEYGMRTNVGNAFVYGDLKAVDTVTYPEIGGAYMYVEKIEEHYNMHTRQVAHTRTVNGHTESYYTTETYWSWDYAGSENLFCKEISFLGVVLDRGKIDIPGSEYIDTIKQSGHVRFKYYGVGLQFTGTIFTELQNKTISNGTPFYENLTIDETVEHLETGGWIVAFWVCWIIFTGACVFGFYFIDNRWLE